MAGPGAGSEAGPGGAGPEVARQRGGLGLGVGRDEAGTRGGERAASEGDGAAAGTRPTVGEAVGTRRGPAGAAERGGGWGGALWRRPGVWAGGLWLGVVGLAGVFAPFLASSHPWRVRLADGSVRWPLLEHLSPVDVALPIVVGLALLTWLMQRFFKRRARRRPAAGGVKVWPLWLGWAGVSLAVGLACTWLVQPPALTVYERYRTGLASGEIASASYTLVPYSPSDRFRDMPERALELPLPPDGRHWMGTTRNGADLLSRMIHASRVALAVGFISTGIALLIGVTLGGLMGYFVGVADLIGMRIVEVFSAIPVMFLLLTFVAFFGRNLYLMMVIIGVTGWVGYARFVRAEFFKLRAMDFVAAARACGLPLWSILFRHMLPNAIAPVLVAASFGVPSAILYEATLSFIGLGLVDEPSWGQMLSQATGTGGGFYWWIAAFPGSAIFLTVFGFNLLGEALRDVVDVKT